MRFTVVSYNVLADSYIKVDRYPGVGDVYLRWSVAARGASLHHKAEGYRKPEAAFEEACRCHRGAPPEVTGVFSGEQRISTGEGIKQKRNLFKRKPF